MLAASRERETGRYGERGERERQGDMERERERHRKIQGDMERERDREIWREREIEREGGRRQKEKTERCLGCQSSPPLGPVSRQQLFVIK